MPRSAQRIASAALAEGFRSWLATREANIPYEVGGSGHLLCEFARSVATSAGKLNDWGMLMNMPEFWHAEEWYELNAQIYSYIQAGILQPLTPYRDIPYSREPWSQVILTPSGKTRLAGDYPPPEHHREYLQRLTAIAPRLDNTERFYVEEALTAFTARLFPASLVMLGCAGEHLIERMADSSSSLVAASQRARYERELRNGNISNIWGLWWPRVEPRLGELFPLETNAARTALPLLFVSVKRARDEAGHPQEVRPSPAEARTALASFIESARFASGVLVWLTEHAPGPE